MTSRRSSGSIPVESAVDPTRSQNITVSWRRSASGAAAIAARATGARGADKTSGNVIGAATDANAGGGASPVSERAAPTKSPNSFRSRR